KSERLMVPVPVGAGRDRKLSNTIEAGGKSTRRRKSEDRMYRHGYYHIIVIGIRIGGGGRAGIVNSPERQLVLLTWDQRRTQAVFQRICANCICVSKLDDLIIRRAV